MAKREGKSDFSRVYLLKGLGTLNEITRQQVQSKKGGACFPQHHVLGLHGSAPLAALPAGGRNGLTKGLQKVMDKSLSTAITYQETVFSHGSGIL